MDSIQNITRTNNKITSWEEDSHTYEVIYNSSNKPVSIRAKQGNFVVQEGILNYNTLGQFIGIVGGINTEMLPTLIAIAMGTVSAETHPVTGVIEISGLEAALGLSCENTWVGAGDSTMNVMGGPNLSGNANSDKASYVLAAAKLKGNLRCLYNGGIVGDTAGDLLSRVRAGEFEPYRGIAKFIVLKIGANDAGKSVAFSQTKQDIDALANYFTGYAEHLIWHTNTPFYPLTAGVANGRSIPTAKASAKIASYIRKKASEIQSAVLIDTYNLLIDNTANTGAMRATYGRASEAALGYIHPGPVGSAVEAAVIVDTLKPLISGHPTVFSNQADTYANWGVDASQVLPNPLLVSNGGTLSGNVTSAGAGGLAGAPLDWTVRETGTAGITVGTCQLVARSDGRGNNARVTAAAGGVAGLPIYELLTATHHAEVSDGAVIQGELTLTTNTLVNFTSANIYLAVTDGNGSRNEYLLSHDTDTASLDNLSDAVFKSKPITLKAPITGLRLRVDIRGASKDFAGVLDFGSPVINILTAF